MSSSAPPRANAFPAKVAQALYLIGLVLALGGLFPRWGAESKHKSAEIVLDAESLVLWKEALGQSGDALDSRLRTAKINSLAVTELHLDSLSDSGEVVIRSDSEFQLDLDSGALGPSAAAERATLQSKVGQGGTFLVFRTAQKSEAVLAQWRVLFGPEVELMAQGRVVWFPVPKRGLRSVGLGFDENRLRELHDQGYSIWLRAENREGLTEEKLRALYAEWGKLTGVEGIIFGGALNEAVGYPDLLEVSAEELRRLGWKIGYIELPERSQQKGIETTVRELPDRTVRVMAVSPAHQMKLDPYRVLGMYSLGARERNIGVLYVRPYAVPGRPELDDEFIFALASDLEQTGEAATFSPARQGPPLPLTLFLALAGGALALLLLDQLEIPYRAYWWVLPGLLVVGTALAGLIGKGVLMRSLLALAVGIAAPLYGFLRWVYPVVVAPPDSPRISDGLRLLVICSSVSLSGGIFLAALLSDTTFLLGLDRFRGVKLLTLGTPLLIVATYLYKRYSKEQIAAGLKSYIAVYQALFAGALLLVLGILYLRTGNDAGAAASDSERALRVVLDRILGVRPRFKEFLMAHPALILTPLAACRVGFLPSLVFVLMAGIGQAGIVDTFAHVHTPLEVTLIRVLLGVALGAVFGLFGFALLKRLPAGGGAGSVDEGNE